MYEALRPRDIGFWRPRLVGDDRERRRVDHDRAHAVDERERVEEDSAADLEASLTEQEQALWARVYADELARLAANGGYPMPRPIDPDVACAARLADLSVEALRERTK